MKRILIIITNFRHGGINRSLQNLLSIINTDDFCFDIFAMEHYGPYQTMLPNCNILKHDKWINALIARYNDTKGIERLRSIFLKLARNVTKYFKFDLNNYLFTHTARRFLNSEYDIAIAYSEGVPTIFASHLTIANKIAWIHCDYSSYSNLENNPNEKVLYESFNSVVCVSEYTRSEFCKYIHSIEEHVFTINNILNTTLMLDADKHNITDICYTKDQFNIVSIGGINVVKRFSKIPQIVKTLIERGCIFKWYLIGSTMQLTEQKELEYNIKKYDVEEYFFWIGSKDNPYPYIAQSDLLVNTSISEACPYVVNESKSLHTPVVCTDFGSASEFIENGINGIIVPIEEMANKIELLIKNKEEYNRIKSNITEFVYDNEHILKQVYSLL